MSRELPTHTLVVSDFYHGPFHGSWSRLKSHITKIGRTTEGRHVTTARVHLILTDPTVSSLSSSDESGIVNASITGEDSFRECVNLSTVQMNYVEVVGDYAFWKCKNLTCVLLPFCHTLGRYTFARCSRLTTLSIPACKTLPSSLFYGGGQNLVDVEVDEGNVDGGKDVFKTCWTLEVMAKAMGFEFVEGGGGRTKAVMEYLRWRKGMDGSKGGYKCAMVCIELCNRYTPDGRPRAEPLTGVMNLLCGKGRDLAGLVMEFKFGVKRGKGDCRKLSKNQILGLAMETRALRWERNKGNMEFWNVIVDKEGRRITLPSAISLGLVTADNAYTHWGLRVDEETGDLIDEGGIYGAQDIILGRVEME